MDLHARGSSASGRTRSPMSDYNLEFVGDIEQKGLSWAYRAKDARNYYASKIVITKPGPLPIGDLVRYAVVNGVERTRAAVPINMPLRRDTLYRVQMTVKGADFSTSVNGQMVDQLVRQALADGRRRLLRRQRRSGFASICPNHGQRHRTRPLSVVPGLFATADLRRCYSFVTKNETM